MLSSAFFDAVRPLFGGSLKQSQVDGMVAIAEGWAKYGDGDKGKLAYVFATAFHESAQTMQAIREYGRGKGKKYGKPDESGKAPYGRGLVQLTWRENYIKADIKLGLGGKLADNYDLALDPAISVRILITGMMEGWFTGKKLSDYIDGDMQQFASARKIVNGTDRASLIADHAKTFLKALETVPATPAPEVPTDASKPWWAILIEIILNFFKGLRK